MIDTKPLWILFTNTGGLAVDDFGVVVIGDYSETEKWIKQLDIDKPRNAPHIAVEYKPNIVQ